MQARLEANAKTRLLRLRLLLVERRADRYRTS
jgi:hypothetical protein